MFDPVEADKDPAGLLTGWLPNQTPIGFIAAARPFNINVQIHFIIIVFWMFLGAAVLLSFDILESSLDPCWPLLDYNLLTEDRHTLISLLDI